MNMRKWGWVFAVPAIILPGVYFWLNFHANRKGAVEPSKAEVAQKVQKLQVPFIANDGQTDEKVKFYAKTFGGTVFVTKEGEIVYALPNNSSELGVQSLESDVRSQRSEDRRQEAEARIQGCRGELHSPNGFSPLERGDFVVSAQSNDKGVCKTTPIPNKNETPPRPLLLEGRTGIALREEFIGARVKTIQGEDPSITKVNYFKGSDSSKWKSNISTYDVVNLGEIYKGIELRLKAYGNNVEKLFCVKPDANPDQIKISLSGIQPPGNPPPTPASGGQLSVPLSEGDKGGGDGINNSSYKGGAAAKSPLDFVVSAQSNEKGARGLWVNEHGELEVETELGTVKFTKPVAYQEIDGQRVDVAVEYYIKKSEIRSRRQEARGQKSESRRQKSELLNPKSKIQNPQLEYGFTVASYDKSHDLIIDPLLASTYLGGSSYDEGYSLALDASGNVYVTGYTRSSDFPTTSGAYDTSYNDNDGWSEVFVSKLDSGLTSLLASTYLGGSSMDYGNSLALDTSGNVYVTGHAGPNFPTTSGAYNTSFNGGWSDVFVSKLDGGLTSLLASTYLGGSGGAYDEEGCSLTLDTSGNVYVTGWTEATDFPTTSGAYDTSSNGSGDVFVSKMDGGLTSLLASTYLGGSGGGRSLALDTSGNVYVTGNTSSTDFPTTSGAYDTSYNDTGATFYNYTGDAFVSKLDGGLTSLLASTYLGGSGGDYGRSLALDTSGNVYVTGNTSSTDFPTASGGYDTAYNGGSYSGDVFVSRLDGGLTSLLASTYLGSSGDDYGYSLALDTSGDVYVTGHAGSNFPTTSGAYDTSYNGVYFYDVFISKLNSGLTSLLASTYLGGNSWNYGISLTLDTSGQVYVTGYTGATNFPTTSGAYDTSYTRGDYGYGDVFVSKLDGDLSAVATSTPTPNASPIPISTPSPSQTCPQGDGDVNEDGKLTAGDALLAFKSVLGSTTLTSCQQSHADVNGNGKVTAADALCIFKAVLKGESPSESLSCE